MHLFYNAISILLPHLKYKKTFSRYLKKSHSKNVLPYKRQLTKLVYLLIRHKLVPPCLAAGRPQEIEVDFAEGQPTIPLLINTVPPKQWQKVEQVYHSSASSCSRK